MKIALLGTGTWGIALTKVLADNKHDVFAYSRNQEQTDLLSNTRKHPHLPKCVIPSSITFSSDFETVCKDSDIVVFAVPSTAIREVANNFKPFYKGQILVTVAKGIENKTLFTTSEIIEDVLNIKNKVVALTGPTHAEEVSIGIPTCIVSACPNFDNATKVAKAFHNSVFRVYTNNDRKGAELCGAFKNIIALACGISDGLGFGDNTKAAIITRGVKELKDLGIAIGANESTFSGLTGIGDLIVTATSNHSRNHNAGYLMGQGKSKEEAIKEIGMVVESINSLPSAMELVKKYNINMPIVVSTYKICFESQNPKNICEYLLGREMKEE